MIRLSARGSQLRCAMCAWSARFWMRPRRRGGSPTSGPYVEERAEPMWRLRITAQVVTTLVPNSVRSVLMMRASWKAHGGVLSCTAACEPDRSGSPTGRAPCRRRSRNCWHPNVRPVLSLRVSDFTQASHADDPDPDCVAPALGRSRACDPLIVGYCFGIRSALSVVLPPGVRWGCARSLTSQRTGMAASRDLLQPPDQVSGLAVKIGQ